MSLLRLNSVIAACCTLTSALLSVYVTEGTQLPVHWNLTGEVDKTVDAVTVLWLPPVVMWLMIGILSSLTFLEPRKTHLEQSRKAIHAITSTVILLMLVVEIGYIALLKGVAFPMHVVIVFSLGIVLLIIGNYLGKTRSNFFIGIRTPWTLTSDENWQRTHRITAPVYMICGAILASACWFVTPSMLGYLLTGLVIPLALFPVLYSWWIWKRQQS